MGSVITPEQIIGGLLSGLSILKPFWPYLILMLIIGFFSTLLDRKPGKGRGRRKKQYRKPKPRYVGPPQHPSPTTVAGAGGPAQSPIEARLLESLAVQPDLPTPTCQHEVYDGSQLVTVPDFAYVDEKIAVYCDGFQYHGNPHRLTGDALKRNFLQQHGWIVITFTGRIINRNLQRCIEDIRKAYARRKSEMAKAQAQVRLQEQLQRELRAQLEMQEKGREEVEKPGQQADRNAGPEAERKADATQNIRTGKTKDGRRYVIVHGGREEAEQVHEGYLQLGQTPGSIREDRAKGHWYFYLD